MKKTCTHTQSGMTLSKETSLKTCVINTIVISSTICLLIGIVLYVIYFTFSADKPRFTITKSETPEIKGGYLESLSKEQLLNRIIIVQNDPPADPSGYQLEIPFIASVIKKHNSHADAESLAKVIVKQSQLAEFDPLFVTSIIFAESNFKTTARSRVGAQGLMQLMPNTAKYVCQQTKIPWLGISALNDPEYNIFLGINYMKYLSSKLYNENIEHTLIAYNWGPGKFNRAKNKNRYIQLPTETSRYKNKILAYYQNIQTAYASYLENVS